MFRRGGSFSTIRGLILGSALLLSPAAAAAQRHGGSSVGGGMNGSVSGSNRPTGVKEEDSLKDFHQALALQATRQQITEFQVLIKSTEAAQVGLQSLAQQLQKETSAPESTGASLGHALETARAATRKFQEGFSPAQKAGLKDILKRLTKSDSDLDQEQKRLDQAFDLKAASPELASRAETLDKALVDFYDLQLALGREMSITLASGRDLAFNLPATKTPVRMESMTIPVTTSGVLAETAAQGSQRTFKLELIADLTELQQNITDVLRAQLDSSETCGQRVSIRQARLTPAAPASLLVVRLHFERWMCLRTSGQQTSNELAESDGTVEIKLTAEIMKEKQNAMVVKAAFGRIDAAGMLSDELHFGALGEDLQDKAAQSLRSAARAGTDFKVALPPALQNSVALQSAKFRDLGVGGLSLPLEGRVEISNQQADQLASQLNQTLCAQQAPAQ
ncbi:MAG TPA: hypothetical protein VIX37_08520 [Candidatus Sulfotelmatobacter sp.]